MFVGVIRTQRDNITRKNFELNNKKESLHPVNVCLVLPYVLSQQTTHLRK